MTSRYVLVGGLASLLLYTSGCETVQSPTVKPSAWHLASLGANVAGISLGDRLTPRQLQLLGTAGSFSDNLARTGDQVLIQRAGQPQINVYSGQGDSGQQYAPPGTLSVQPETITEEQKQQEYESAIREHLKEDPYVAFACNNWIDLNNDGKWAPDEFLGIKKRFAKDEKIILALKYQNVIGPTAPLVLRVYNSQTGDKLLQKESFWYNNSCLLMKHSFESNSIPDGQYIAVWSLGGHIQGNPLAFKREESERGTGTGQVKKTKEETKLRLEMMEILKSYKELRDKGILTEEQYQEKIKPYLDKI